MNKEQQIAEMATFIHGRRDKNGSEKTAKALFEAGYRKVSKGSFICSGSEANLDVEVCNNCEKQQADELFERDKEIERLQKENEALKRVDNRVAFCKAYDQIRAENKRLKAVNERFASNMKNVLEIEKENAVKAFAEHLKKYAIKTNSPAWGLIEFVKVSDIDKLLLTDY